MSRDIYLIRARVAGHQLFEIVKICASSMRRKAQEIRILQGNCKIIICPMKKDEMSEEALKDLGTRVNTRVRVRASYSFKI